MQQNRAQIRFVIMAKKKSEPQYSVFIPSFHFKDDEVTVVFTGLVLSHLALTSRQTCEKLPCLPCLYENL